MNTLRLFPCSFSLLISENERQLGFIVVIDRRSDRWMAVKSIMSYIEVRVSVTLL